MIFEKETDERTEETSSSKRIGVVDHKIALTDDFRGAKLDFLGISDKKRMAE